MRKQKFAKRIEFRTGEALFWNCDPNWSINEVYRRILIVRAVIDGHKQILYTGCIVGYLCVCNRHKHMLHMRYNYYLTSDHYTVQLHCSSIKKISTQILCFTALISHRLGYSQTIALDDCLLSFNWRSEIVFIFFGAYTRLPDHGTPYTNIHTHRSNQH